MSRFVICIAFVVGSLSLPAWSSSLGTPVAEYDFGETTTVGLMTHEFAVVNKTTSSIALRVLRTSCGCTTAILVSTRLNPGDCTTLSVTLDTHLKSGLVYTYVRLLQTEPTPNEMVYGLKAFVRKPFQCEPEFIDVGTMRRGEAIQRVLSIKGYVEDGIKIAETVCSNPAIRVARVQAGNDPRKEVHATIEVAAHEEGRILGEVAFRLANERDEARCIVRGTVIGDQLSTPSVVFLKHGQSEGTFTVSRGVSPVSSILELQLCGSSDTEDTYQYKVHGSVLEKPRRGKIGECLMTSGTGKSIGAIPIVR